MKHQCCVCKYTWEDPRHGHLCETCPVCGTCQDVYYIPEPEPQANGAQASLTVTPTDLKPD